MNTEKRGLIVIHGTRINRTRMDADKGDADEHGKTRNYMDKWDADGRG